MGVVVFGDEGRRAVVVGGGTVVQAGRDAAVTVAPAARRPVPRQLPAAPRTFVGREAALAALDGALIGPGTAVSVIGGPGGIGKTSLAVVWAHRNADRFPDGQLFVDLHGFSPSWPPTTASDALGGFLDALGVDPRGVPPEVDARAALFRSLVADRRVLVVLDNAAAADQVVPLLPGDPTCAVLVTGRTVLSSVIDRYGARHLHLGVLDRGEARALLAARLGARRVDTDAVDELIALCGHHPLALTITARRALTRPGLPTVALVAELRDLGPEVFDHEHDPAAGLPTVLSWSLRHLTDRQRRAFALLGVAPGPDSALPALAALLDLPPTPTRAVLRALADASLVAHVPGGRFGMHDLVRAYAVTVADGELTRRDRDAALRRSVDHYERTAHAGDRLLNTRRASAGSPPAPVFADRTAALAWFDAERVTLLAAQRAAADAGWHDAVADLAWASASFHDRRGHLHDRVTVWRTVLDLAAHLPPATRIRAHRPPGSAPTATWAARTATSGTTTRGSSTCARPWPWRRNRATSPSRATPTASWGGSGPWPAKTGARWTTPSAPWPASAPSTTGCGRRTPSTTWPGTGPAWASTTGPARTAGPP
ncbi:hypothetical protein [Actinosynnema sp. NPDC020468]|uniref:hypothetical protein n=1 Tax=Actinosynnema sp. NPDC020468 TaxID=3154488 RepID=UPI0034109F45